MAGRARLDTSIVAHQGAKFSSNLKACHDTAAKNGKFLLDGEDKGLPCEPDLTKGLETFADTDFTRVFDKASAEDPAFSRSRNSFIIKHTVFSLLSGSLN